MAGGISLFDHMVRRAAWVSITGYQRYLSPHKGFCCAHRVLHGGESCSAYGKRTLFEEGLRAGLPLLRQRLRDCKTAHQTLRARRLASEANAPEPPAAEPNVIGGRGDTSDASAPEETTTKKNATKGCGSTSSGSGCDGCGDVTCLSCEALSCLSDCGTLDCAALDCGSCSSCSLL